jgi:magnesium-transporting ATPase (P-type)
MLYNVFWTSWPCIFTFVFERDVDAKTSLVTPILYEAGPKAIYFNFRVFWKWMLLAVYHGWVCYFFPILGFKGVENSLGLTS